MKTRGRQLVLEIESALALQNDELALGLISRSFNSWFRRRDCADALVHFAEEGAIAIVDLFRSCGVPIDLPNAEGYSALEVLAHHGASVTAGELLGRGASPSRTGRGRGIPSAFMLAAFRGDEGLVASMLEHGAETVDITQLSVASLLRISGSILRLVKSAGGGDFPDDIEELLTLKRALGDQESVNPHES